MSSRKSHSITVAIPSSRTAKESRMADQEDVGPKSLAIGQVSAVVAAVLFGTAYVATSVAIRSFTPLGAAMWRGILSTLVLVPAVAATRQAGAGALNRSRTWRLIVLEIGRASCRERV
jgi:protein-S-isoprenylcysteine O-methyltransferase Ste14